jgi:hypothetical protein
MPSVAGPVVDKHGVDKLLRGSQSKTQIFTALLAILALSVEIVDS